MPRALRATPALLLVLFAAPLASVASTPTVSRLVLLDAPTRWDAWHAASSAGTSAVVAARADAVAAAARVRRLAAPVEAYVRAAGGLVVSRYDTATAGLLVRVPQDAIPLLRRLPGVRAVGPAPRLEVHLRDSVPAIGARRAAEALALDGEGVTIAILDTGIDYTHGTFGGAGTEAAYDANDPNYVEPNSFPTAKVVDGWDLAGPLYSPECTPAGEQGGSCSAVPGPDADPLDTLGHGTHVAGIAAGVDDGPVASGVAPGARLVALKIFGSTGTTELILDGLEWAIGANMGARGRAHVDVLNMSFGQAYGAEVIDEAGAVDRALEAGIVVVASTGNDGDLPFIAAAPGIAPGALAVASHTPPGRHVWQAEVAVGAEPPATFGEEAVYLQPWSPDPRDALAAPVVYVGRGCPGDAIQPADVYLADPRGAVGMFELAWGGGGPACTADRQAARLEAAGAVGALMATAIGIEEASRWDGEPLVDIPVWMVNTALETVVADGGRAGRPMTATLRPVPLPELTGLVSGFSSRGPSRQGLALKPDLSAPGAGIVSAAMGHGRRGMTSSGTSMATPHVAGTAALVWQAARRAGRALSARDVAAIVVTTADPSGVREDTEVAGAPLARAGAGAVDAWAAVNADTVVRAGPLASLSLGFGALDGPRRLRGAIQITNLSAAPHRYRLTARHRRPEAALGLSVAALEPLVEVGAGERRDVEVEAALRPAFLPPWGLAGGANVSSAEAMAESEQDGWIEVVEAEPDGVPLAGAQTLRLPFYLMARRAAAVAAAWAGPASAAPDAPLAVDLANGSPFAGTAEVFTLAATDPADPAVPPKIDLDAVGVRATPDGEGGTVVEFALHARGTRVHPLETNSLIQLDTNADGTADFHVYTDDEETLRTGNFRNGKVRVALEPPEGGPFGSPVTRFYAGVDLMGRSTVLPILIEDTGLTPSTLAFDFRVQQRDFVEKDIFRDPQYDQVPGGGGWLHFDARRPALAAETTSVALEGGAGRAVAVTRGEGFGDALRPGLMVLFPANAPGDGDMAILRIGGGEPVYLPWLADQ